jgi:hypothetical protein
MFCESLTLENRLHAVDVDIGLIVPASDMFTFCFRYSF